VSSTVIIQEEQILKPTLGLMLLHSVSKLLQFLWTFTAQSETHKKSLKLFLSFPSRQRKSNI